MYTDNFVDLARLKTCALHGVPPEIRAEVWKYLLDVSKLDKSEEVSLSKKLVEKYEEMAEASQNDMEILRKVKAQLRSYKSPLWEAALDAKGRKMMERVAVCYLAQNSDVPYDDALSITHFLPPFVYCAQEESDAYYCFQGLMQRVSALLPFNDLRLRMARFIMLFKTLFPEINAALEGNLPAIKAPILPPSYAPSKHLRQLFPRPPPQRKGSSPTSGRSPGCTSSSAASCPSTAACASGTPISVTSFPSPPPARPPLRSASHPLHPSPDQPACPCRPANRPSADQPRRTPSLVRARSGRPGHAQPRPPAHPPARPPARTLPTPCCVHRSHFVVCT